MFYSKLNIFKLNSFWPLINRTYNQQNKSYNKTNIYSFLNYFYDPKISKIENF